MIYILVALYLFLLSYRFDLKERKFGYIFHQRLSLIILIGVAGFRYRIAPDSITYMGDFAYRIANLWDLNLESFTLTRYQPLWIFLNSVCKTIWNDFVGFQLISAIIINYSFSYFFKMSSSKYFTCLFFYYISCYVYFNMEIVREALAISMFLLSLVKYNEGKLKQCIIFFFMAVLFHAFALIIGLVYVFLSEKIPQIFKNLIAISVIFLIIFIPNPLVLFSGFFGGEIGSQLEQYSIMKLGTMTLSGYLFMISRIVIVYLALVFFGKIKAIPYARLDMRILQNLSILYIVLIIVRSISIPYLERIINYFSVIIIVYLVSYMYNVIKRKGMKQFQKASFLLIGLLVIFLNVYPMMKFIPEWNAPYYKRYYPYDSVFEKNKDPDREYIIRYEAKEY